MSPDAQVILVALLGVAVVVLGVLAWRGVISWGWVAAAASGLIAMLAGVGRRRTSAQPPIPPALAQPTAIARTALVEADKRTAEDLADIAAANEETDPGRRLERLAGLDNGGRE